MREIKFRAWFTDSERKVMEGQKCSMQGERTLLEFLQAIKDTSEEYKYNYILMQYTGLKDKNGVEIYEGDIVRLFDAEKLQIIIFNRGAFALQLQDDGTAYRSLYHQYQADIEVIGNIYENPELLK